MKSNAVKKAIIPEQLQCFTKNLTGQPKLDHLFYFETDEIKYQIERSWYK